MKLSKNQLEMVRQAITNRIFAAAKVAVDQAAAEVGLLRKAEMEEKKQQVQSQHKALFAKIEKLRQALDAHDQKRKEMVNELASVAIPLLAHFESMPSGAQFGYVSIPDFDRPIFKPSETLTTKQADFEKLNQESRSVSHAKVDDIILRLSFSDDPDVKAILAEYGINLNTK